LIAICPERSRHGLNWVVSGCLPSLDLLSGILAPAQERDERGRSRDHQHTRLIFGQQRLKAGAQGMIYQSFDHVGVALLRPARASHLIKRRMGLNMGWNKARHNDLRPEVVMSRTTGRCLSAPHAKD
jgi:hypothetical protein